MTFYSNSFINAIDFVLTMEGGYVNHPSDPGGETNFGISKRSYPDVDIQSLTEEAATAIYYRDYWQPMYCDELHECVGYWLLDTAVQHGSKRAV